MGFFDGVRGRLLPQRTEQDAQPQNDAQGPPAGGVSFVVHQAVPADFMQQFPSGREKPYRGQLGIYRRETEAGWHGDWYIGMLRKDSTTGENVPVGANPSNVSGDVGHRLDDLTLSRSLQMLPGYSLERSDLHEALQRMTVPHGADLSRESEALFGQEAPEHDQRDQSEIVSEATSISTFGEQQAQQLAPLRSEFSVKCPAGTDTRQYQGPGFG